MPNLTLPINLLVNVDIDYSPRLLGEGDFATACIIGSTATERESVTGLYASLAAVLEHYEETDKEYLVAQKLFSQVPRPKLVMIATVSDLTFPDKE